jgi:oligoendopeptidase F
MKTTDDLPEWDLDGFFPRGKIYIPGAVSRLSLRVKKFEQAREGLASPEPLAPGEFLKILREYEEINRKARLLVCYADLKFDHDGSKNKFAFMVDLTNKINRLKQRLDFFELWWKDLPDDQAQLFLHEAPRNHYYLTRARAYNEHALIEPVERIIKLKDFNGRDALIELYLSITRDFVFWPEFLPPKERRQLDEGELFDYSEDARPEYRAGSYQELFRLYEKNRWPLFTIYKNLTQDWYSEKVVSRKYASPIAVNNKKLDLKDETVESLLRVCRKKVPEVFGQYFKAKAKRLGLAQLRLYDLELSIKPDQKIYSFNQALNEVRAAFKAFDPGFAKLAQKVIKAKRLSAGLGPNKSEDNYCTASSPGQIPWIRINFKGHHIDLLTLAHELAHAVHISLASNKNFFEFNPKEPMGESPSLFGEMLLAKFLKKSGQLKDLEALNFIFLERTYQFVGRQAFYTIFEIEAHRMIINGASLDEIAQTYLKLLNEQFGDSVLVSEEFRWEWLTMPRFFLSPLSAYGSIFSYLLAYSLWNIYESDGPSFVPKFMALLAQGGSGSPDELLRRAGFGPLDDHFWSGGFEAIKNLMPSD